MDLLDGAVIGCDEVVVHLHGLEGEELFTLLDLVVLFHEDLDDRAGDEGEDLLRIRRDIGLPGQVLPGKLCPECRLVNGKIFELYIVAHNSSFVISH